MAEFGHYALCLSWFLSLTGMITGIISGWKGKRGLFYTTVNATIMVFACLAIATGVLAYSFYTNDYSNQYVWQYSNRDMPGIYKISAIWGGMDGSMLLWCFMLSISAMLVARQAEYYPRLLMPWVLSVLNSSQFFFISVVVFYTNPFRYLKHHTVLADGNGLNPLLQNPFMAIHPPTLYAGFTTFAVPYAFCVGALLAGQLNNEWIRLTRRWTLVAWGFLTAGIVLGGFWAYIELGWGGFWAWDPVENASFLPWLTGTAFLHSVMVQERKNMLKQWNIWLVVGTYVLTVFGTFLTRSGIVQSVHAFASADNVGSFFLGYMCVVVAITAVLCFVRRSDLRSERNIESMLSREAAFLINNLVFLSICFATLWGVMFPVLSEAVTGTKQAVSIPFFNAINVPLFLLLIFLMGVGPLIAWRKASLTSIRKTFLLPFVLALGVALLLVLAGITSFYPVLSYSLCFFVLLTILGEFHRGLKVQASSTPSSNLAENTSHLIRRHRTRYGGYLVHLGVLVMTIGITASMAHKVEQEFSLAVGEKFTVGKYTLELNDLQERRASNFQALSAVTQLSRTRDAKLVKVLEPEFRLYLGKNGQVKEQTSEVALYTGILQDVYLVLAGIENNRAAFKIFINPLQIWLWIGAIVVVIGTAIVAVPRSNPVSSRVSELAEAKDYTKA